MKINLLGVVFIATFSALALSSCSVDQEAALFSRPAARGGSEKSKKTTVKTGEKFDWAARIEDAKKKIEEVKAQADKERAVKLAVREKEDAAKLAEKKKADALESRNLAAAKKKEDAAKRVEESEEKALAKKEMKDKATAEAARNLEIAEAKKAKEQERAAARNAELEQDSQASDDVAGMATRLIGGGFFSRLSSRTPSEYKSEGHYVNVNQRLLPYLSASNAKIEIDISEQRARVYKTGAGGQQLVIETQISTGKSGHSTSPGTFQIKEKLIAKSSTLYGSWVNSSGSTVSSSGDSRSRPGGASRFVGAEMPYWLRINGGIGMHIGYVPDHPASHGCIRVPPSIQPLIFSKVGVGTSVTIKH